MNLLNNVKLENGRVITEADCSMSWNEFLELMSAKGFEIAYRESYDPWRKSRKFYNNVLNFLADAVQESERENNGNPAFWETVLKLYEMYLDEGSDAPRLKWLMFNHFAINFDSDCVVEYVQSMFNYNHIPSGYSLPRLYELALNKLVVEYKDLEELVLFGNREFGLLVKATTSTWKAEKTLSSAKIYGQVIERSDGEVSSIISCSTYKNGVYCFEREVQKNTFQQLADVYKVAKPCATWMNPFQSLSLHTYADKQEIDVCNDPNDDWEGVNVKKINKSFSWLGDMIRSDKRTALYYRKRKEEDMGKTI